MQPNVAGSSDGRAPPSAVGSGKLGDEDEREEGAGFKAAFPGQKELPVVAMGTLPVT